MLVIYVLSTYQIRRKNIKKEDNLYDHQISFLYTKYVKYVSQNVNTFIHWKKNL
jgi:hypothetical protein